jgi:hypothetical protein
MNTFEVFSADGYEATREAPAARGAIAALLRERGLPCRPGHVNAAEKAGWRAELQFDPAVVRRWGPLSPLVGLLAWCAGAHSTGGAYLPLGMEETIFADLQGGVLTPLNLKTLHARAYSRACAYPGWYAPRQADEAYPEKLVWTTSHARLTLLLREDGMLDLEMVGRQESRLAAIEARVSDWTGRETDAMGLPLDPPFEDVAPMGPTVPGVAPGWALKGLPWQLRRELGAVSGQDPDDLQDIVLAKVESQMDPADVVALRERLGLIG